MKHFLLSTLSTLLVFTNIYEVCCYMYPLCKRNGNSCAGESDNKLEEGSLLTWILGSLQCGFCYYWPLLGLKNIYDCISSDGWFYFNQESPSFLDYTLEWMGVKVSSRRDSQTCVTSVYIILAWILLVSMVIVGMRYSSTLYKSYISNWTKKTFSNFLDEKEIMNDKQQ